MDRLITANSIELESFWNEKPERRQLQKEAEELAAVIAALPDLDKKVITTIDFLDESVIEFYLGDLHIKVQTLIERAFKLSNHNGTLSKSQCLNNFVLICTRTGMGTLNPFNCFILRTHNYDKLLRGRL